MNKVTLAIALTGSCALFYLLYTMKQKSKERSLKKIKSQVENNESKCQNEENSQSIFHSKNNKHSKETIEITEKPSDLPCNTSPHSRIGAKESPSKGSEVYSSCNFSLSSESGFHDFFLDNINEIISECNLSEIPEIVENSSSRCPNVFKAKINVNNEMNSLSISNADAHHIPVSTVPEKMSEDGCQISMPQKSLSNNKSNISSSLSGSTPKFEAVQDLEKLDIAPIPCEDDCSPSAPKYDGSISVQAEDYPLEAPKNMAVELPQDKSTSSLSSHQDCNSSILVAKENSEPVPPIAKSDSLLTKKEYPLDILSKNCPVTKLEMEMPQKSKKKQRQRGKKSTSKNPPIDQCRDALQQPDDAVNKVHDLKSSKYSHDSDIKKGCWSISEVEENLKKESGLIESKVVAQSPDPLCTSDLERETSQTPEHENIISDSQSLASFDSGQGSIEQETIFSNMLIPEDNSDYYITYQFEIPQDLVGKLIGKKGAFLNKIKAATSTNVVVVPHNDDKFKLCSIEGKKWQVLQSLDLIRDHFPAQKFPELCLDQINIPSPQQQPQMNRQLLQVELPPGVVLEVQTSSIISTGEVWLQQPLHPTFSALQRLHQCLNLNYGDGSSTPTVPLTTPAGTVCVCQIGDQWLRCQVEEFYDDDATVCLLDVGGYVSLPITLLRQIRVDYASLPFQASRCYLYGIEPKTEDGWDEEGRASLLQLCNNTIIFATIAAYSEDGIPLVNLYQRHFNQYTFINEQMVKLNHAKWISTPSFAEST